MKDKRTVIITGASRGLGRSIAYKFAENNYNIVATYLNSKEEATNLKKDLESKYKVSVLLLEINLAREDEIKYLAEKTIDVFSKIDVLVNNASICFDTILEDKTKDNFLKILDVNLVGTFLVTKYISKFMLEKNSGNIINISSTNGIDTGYIESMDYDASKAGVISLTHNFAKYLAPNINVNCVCPGWIDTDMNKELSKEFKKQEENKILLKRFAKPEEIANVIYFLSTKEAKYLNDTVIRVDGGRCN